MGAAALAHGAQKLERFVLLLRRSHESAVEDAALFLGVDQALSAKTHRFVQHLKGLEVLPQQPETASSGEDPPISAVERSTPLRPCDEGLNESSQLSLIDVP